MKGPTVVPTSGGGGGDGANASRRGYGCVRVSLAAAVSVTSVCASGSVLFGGGISRGVSAFKGGRPGAARFSLINGRTSHAGCTARPSGTTSGVAPHRARMSRECRLCWRHETVNPSTRHRAPQIFRSGRKRTASVKAAFRWRAGTVRQPDTAARAGGCSGSASP